MRTIAFLATTSLLVACGASNNAPSSIDQNSGGLTLSVANGGYLAYKEDYGEWQQVSYETALNLSSRLGVLSIASSCMNTFPIEITIEDLPASRLIKDIAEGRFPNRIDACDRRQTLSYSQTDTTFALHDATITHQVSASIQGHSAMLVNKHPQEAANTAFVATKAQRPYLICESELSFNNGDQRPLDFNQAQPGTAFQEPAHNARSYTAGVYVPATNSTLSVPSTRQGRYWDFTQHTHCNNLIQQTWEYQVAGLDNPLYLTRFDNVPIENETGPIATGTGPYLQTFRYSDTRIQSSVPELGFTGIPLNAFRYQLTLSASSIADRLTLRYIGQAAQSVSLNLYLYTLDQLPGLDGFIRTDIDIHSADMQVFWSDFYSPTSSYATTNAGVSVTQPPVAE